MAHSLTIMTRWVASNRLGRLRTCSHGWTRTLERPSPASWTYSNVGYLFVRQLIEHAEGKEIGEALTRLVLMPLGIANTGLARTPDDLIGTRWGNARRYHPGWVYHGLMIGSVMTSAWPVATSR